MLEILCIIWFWITATLENVMIESAGSVLMVIVNYDSRYTGEPGVSVYKWQP